LIHEGLAEDKTVIVDATHLKKSYLQRFEYWNVPIEYKYFDINIEIAIERDSKRKRSVGAEIIKRQHAQYLEMQRQSIPSKTFEPTEFANTYMKPGVWVFDIDGTIAHNNSGRSPFDWKRVGEDDLDLAVSDLFHKLNTDEIFFCSGRDESCREETLNWLRKHLGIHN
jgi:hypothetical protein